jgi:hypothetical protein
MKYIFFIATLLGLVCFFISDTKSEMLAWASSICFALACTLLANKYEKLKKGNDEGR